MSVRNTIKILRTATFNITPTKLLRSPHILTQTILVQTCRRYASDTKRPCKELERVDCEGHVSKPVCLPCPCKERAPCRMRHVKRYMLNVKCCPPRVGCRPPCKVRRDCVVLNCQNRTPRQKKLFACFPGDKLNRRRYHTNYSVANSAKMYMARRQAGESTAQQRHYEMEVKLAECHKVITSPGCADAICVEQCKQLLKQQCLECNFNSEECSRYRNRCVSTPANPICDSCYQIKTVSDRQYVLNPGLCDGKPTLGRCGPDRIPPPPIRVELKENQNYDKCKIPQGHIDPCAHKPTVVVTIERPKHGPEQCVNMCKHECNMTIPNCNQNGGNQLSNQCTYNTDRRPGQLPDLSAEDKCSWCRENCPQTQATQCQNLNTTTNPCAHKQPVFGNIERPKINNSDPISVCRLKDECDRAPCTGTNTQKPPGNESHNPNPCNQNVGNQCACYHNCRPSQLSDPSAGDKCNWRLKHCCRSQLKPNQETYHNVPTNQQSTNGNHSTSLETIEPGKCPKTCVLDCSASHIPDRDCVEIIGGCRHCIKEPKPIGDPCTSIITAPSPENIGHPLVCQGKPASNPKAYQNPSKPICDPCSDNQETKPNPGISHPPVCQGKLATNPGTADTCKWCQQNCDQNPVKPICGPCSNNQETKPNPGISNPPVYQGKLVSNLSAAATCNCCQQNCDQNPAKPVCDPCSDNQETKPKPGISNPPVYQGKLASNPSAVDTCNCCQQPVYQGKLASNPSAVDTCNCCQQNCDQNLAKPICDPCSDNQQSKPNPVIGSIISTVIKSYKQVTCPKTCKLTCGPCQDPNLYPGDKEWCSKLPPQMPCDETACCKEPTFCEKIKRRYECNTVDPKDVSPSTQEKECPCPSSPNNQCMQPNQDPCSTSKRKFHTSSLHLNPDKMKDGEKKLQEVLTKARVLISQKTDKPREFTGKIRIGMPATNCKNVEKLRIDMEFNNDLFTFRNDLKEKPEGLSNAVHNNEEPASCLTTKKSESGSNTSVKQADNIKSAKPECKTGKMCPKWTVSRYPPNPCSEKGKQSPNPTDTTKTAKKPEATNSPCKPSSCSALQDLPKCVKIPVTMGKPCPPKVTKPEVNKSRSIESIKKLVQELKRVNEKIKSMDKSSIHNHMKKPIDSVKPQSSKSSKPKIPGCDNLQSNLKASKSDTCTSKKSPNKSAMDSWKEMKCPKKSFPKVPPTSSHPSKQDIKEKAAKSSFETLASNTKSTTKTSENKPKPKTGSTPSSGNSKPKNLKFSKSSFLDYLRFPRINTYDEVANHFYVHKGASVSEINRTQELQVIYERNMMNIKNYDKCSRFEFFVTRPRNELISYISAKLRKFFSN